MSDDTASPPPDSGALSAVPGTESTVRELNGVDLHVVTAGDPGDPPVVLLHGFPDFWFGWRHQVPALVDAGYRVLAPDGRGYNRSEKPAGARSYRLSTLSADVAALVDSLDRASAHVVGHDWGGTVAWDLALRRPRVLDRLAVLNAPHPTVFLRTLRSSPRQIRRSWYMFFFQVPKLPEWLLTRNDCERLTDGLRRTATAGAFTDRELARYREAWGREGAVTGMLNWYRALLWAPDRPPRDRVDAPTLVVWGERDTVLVPEMAEESLTYCTDGDTETFPTASHWVQMEKPAAVNEHLVDHLSG